MPGALGAFRREQTGHRGDKSLSGIGERRASGSFDCADRCASCSAQDDTGVSSRAAFRSAHDDTGSTSHHALRPPLVTIETMLSAPHWRYLWLVAASLLAGFINAMAGGGSFLSFPAMLGMGVPPVQANATNTLALWPGQITSLATLRGDLRRDLLWPVVITSVIGGVAGAEVLLHTRQSTFLRLIPWLILGGTLIFGISPYISRWLRSRSAHQHADRAIPVLPVSLALFPVCFYVGYFGAGGGFLVMTILALFGVEEMYTLNALKVLAAMTSNFVAIVTFVVKGAIVWHYCLLSMIFAALGGYLGARMTKRISAETLRRFVVGTGLVISAYFFYKQAHGA